MPEIAEFRNDILSWAWLKSSIKHMSAGWKITKPTELEIGNEKKKRQKWSRKRKSYLKYHQSCVSAAGSGGQADGGVLANQVARLERDRLLV